ncbi:MAG TPA: type II asparaginase [Candidatus Binatia bacterium]|nr:type II asparaginase [Candidatus Binatia bacterium]
MNGIASRTLRGTTVAVVTLLLAASAATAKPKVMILATGGTIAGAQASTIEAGYKSGTFSVDDLIKAVPHLGDLADISGEQVANIGSQTMNHEVWLKLAARINAVLKGDTDGVVVTHGTDTMEETAYFLGLVVKSDKPVVLAGSMRPATAISADGPANLYNAVALAANPDAKGRGPLIVLNDEIHYAHEAQKTNSTQLDTFKSPNRGRAGVMNTGKAYFFSQNTARHTTKSEFSVDGKVAKDLPWVEVVYSYANFGRDTIDFLVSKGVKGIVLAGVGDGNSTDDAIAALADAAKKGIAVVRSTRTGSGLVVRNVEVDDDKLGFIAAMELNPQKARVLLLLGLMKTRDPKALQALFMEY